MAKASSRTLSAGIKTLLKVSNAAEITVVDGERAMRLPSPWYPSHPTLVDAIRELKASGRSLRRCSVCPRVFVATHDRQQRCDACRRAGRRRRDPKKAAAYMRQYREEHPLLKLRRR